MAEENFLHPRYWPTWVGYWLIWVVVRLPQRVRLFIGARLGDLARWLAVDRRRIVLRNIELCFPELDEQARARLVRDIFRSGGMSIIETAVAWLGRGSSVVGRMTIEGVEHLRAAQARGKGVILMGMHMQTLDLAGACLSQEIGLNVMYRANKNLLIEKIMTEGRKRLYPSAIERGDVRSVISSLSAGDIVWYGPDQDYGARNAVFVPFLGVPAATTTAASRIAKITGAAVVPITYLRVD
ncbi:MAG: lipid A biosynthesis lauroyl acyltransferase, partial [Pseudomonadales bacterium]|nr:lipid A biosynthesis lauroyl acyltransferase [Pseudomonadales bacterium]